MLDWLFGRDCLGKDRLSSCVQHRGACSLLFLAQRSTRRRARLAIATVLYSAVAVAIYRTASPRSRGATQLACVSLSHLLVYPDRPCTAPHFEAARPTVPHALWRQVFLPTPAITVRYP